MTRRRLIAHLAFRLLALAEFTAVTVAIAIQIVRHI